MKKVILALSFAIILVLVAFAHQKNSGTAYIKVPDCATSDVANLNTNGLKVDAELEDMACCPTSSVSVSLTASNLNNITKIYRGTGCTSFTLNVSGEPTIATGGISASNGGPISVQNLGPGAVWGHITAGCTGQSTYIPYSNRIMPGTTRVLTTVNYACECM